MIKKDTNNNPPDDLNWEDDGKTFIMPDIGESDPQTSQLADEKKSWWTIFPSFHKAKDFNINVIFETRERRIAISVTVAIIPIIALLAHFFTPSKKTVAPLTNKEYYQVEMKQPEGKNYLEFSLKLFDHKTEQFSTSIIDVDDLKDIIKNIRYTQSSIPLYYEGNKIFPCSKDTGVLYFVFEPTDTAISFDIPSSGVPFRLNGRPHNTLAACSKSLEPGDVIARGVKPCSIEVQIPNDYTNKPYKVSVTGRQGPYEHQLIWDIPNGFERFDVWVYFENEDTNTYKPIPSISNATRITKAGCSGCDAKAQQQIIAEFTSLANNFGSNPSDRTALRAFRNFCDSRFETLRIKVNGATQQYWSDMEALMKTSHFNDKKRYRIRGVVLINECAGISFEFNEINPS